VAIPFLHGYSHNHRSASVRARNNHSDQSKHLFRPPSWPLRLFHGGIGPFFTVKLAWVNTSRFIRTSRATDRDGWADGTG